MTLTLRVRAIDEAGAPVSGAIVRHDEANVATTDAEGAAMIAGITTGFDLVTVTHAMPAEVELVLSIGDGSSGVIERTVVLRRGAPLRGTVVTPEGKALPGALVNVWCEDGRTRFLQSDDQGSWSLPALVAGAFEVRARADGYALGPTISGTHDGRTEQDGVVVSVAIGACLRGRVLDELGQPAIGVSVYTEVLPDDNASATTDDDGRFEIRGLGAGRRLVSVGRGRWTSSVVMPGDGEQYQLDIELPELAPRPDPEHAPAEEEDPESALTATLTGRVVRDGAPVSRFAILRRGVAAYRWISDAAMFEAPDGRFTLTDLHESSCSLHVLALGTAWTSTETLAVEPGSTFDVGDIVLERGSRIAGIVCTAAGEPIAGAHVTIGSRNDRNDALGDAVNGYFATTSGADGAFVFDGVHVRSRHETLCARHPAHGVSLQHALDDTAQTFRLVLLPTGGIDGTIDPHSAIHSGLIARAMAPNGGGQVVHVRPSGYFVINDLVPGDYVIYLIQRPGWPPREVHATVVAGQRTRVHIPPA